MNLRKITSYVLIFILGFYINLETFMVYALSPNDISNQVFFLDAQDTDADWDNTNEPADWSNIWNLVDKFNSNTGSQSDSNKQPVYNINSINSYPSLSFDWNNDLLNLADNLEISNNTEFPEKSYAMIIKTWTDINTFQTIYDEGTKEKGFAFQIENNHIYAWAYNTIDWSSPDQFKTIDLWIIDPDTIYTIFFVYDQVNDSIKWYLDWNLINTLNNISLQTTHWACTFDTSFGCTIYDNWWTLALGSTKNDTLKLSDNSEITWYELNPFFWKIWEISSYNHALTDSEISWLDDYLTTKWWLNSAPWKIFHFDAQNVDWDFTDSNEPANNTQIATWTDINKWYNATQATTDNQATYQTNTINSHPSIYFDWTNDWYDIANQTDINTADTYSEKSFSMVLKTSDDISSFQNLYEQWGWRRWYGIQIENWHLYIWAWNNQEWDDWHQYKFVDLWTISTNTIYNILITQNSTSWDDSTNIIKAYINWNLAWILDHVDIQNKHSWDINLWYNKDGVKYDWTTPWEWFYFKWNIWEYISWNHALTDTEISDLNDYLIERWDLDSIAPTIWSSNIINDQILPGWNHSIEYNYSDNDWWTWVDTSSASIILEKWDWSSWINQTSISQDSINSTQAVYSVSNLSFWKYRTTFNISDNVWNTSINYITTFYIDAPELIISTWSINIWELNNDSNTFWDTITITVKTIWAWFNVKLKKNENLQLNSWEVIPYYDWTIWMWYDKNNDWNLSDYNDDIILNDSWTLNTDWELNTYTYNLKIWAIISAQQMAWDYSWKIDFLIELAY